mgnify:FL=1
MNKKIILYGVLFIILAILAFATFSKSGINTATGNSINNAGGGDYSGLPEKCRPPQGQDIQSWKEHLGHHEETRDCLNYFK